MRKVVLLVAGALLIVVLMSTSAFAFSDVRGASPYHTAITALADWEVIGGYNDNTFRPTETVKRAQFAKMAANMFRVSVSEGMSSPFTDLGANNAGSLYPHEYVAVAYRHGITKGKTSSTFDPYGEITRAQAITMTVRAAQNLHPGALDATVYSWHGPWGDFSPAHGRTSMIADANYLFENLDYSGVSAWSPMPRQEVAQLLYNLQEHLPARDMEASFGQSHVVDGVKVTVGPLEQLPPSEYDGGPEAGNQYLGTYVTFSNQGNATFDVWPSDFFLISTADGQKYDDTVYGIDDRLGSESELKPGMQVRGYVAFEVPLSDTGFRAYFDHDSYDYVDYVWE